VGDLMYGAARRARSLRDETLREACLNMSRQALHAAVLRFLHPRTGKDLCFTAPLPEDMMNLCGALAPEIDWAGLIAKEAAIE
jgi:23S rRNA pseudouridine1911/1915/1917 synthase